MGGEELTSWYQADSFELRDDQPIAGGLGGSSCSDQLSTLHMLVSSDLLCISDTSVIVFG